MKKDSIGAEPLAISTYGLVPSLEISSYLGIEKKGEKRDWTEKIKEREKGK